MYQVIRTYGDNEPWWFFDGWQEDIQKTKDFDDFEAASQFFTAEWARLRKQKANSDGKPNFMTAFWDDDDERWCEECGDYLTQFTGLMLLKDGQPVSEECAQRFYERQGQMAQIKTCKLPLAKA